MSIAGTWKLSSRFPKAVSHPNLTSIESKALRNSVNIDFESNKNEISSSNSNFQNYNNITQNETQSPAVPSTKEANVEVYGFVGWVGSFFAFGLYLMWAYLPDSFLHELGVSYYPNKWWAIAFPAYYSVTIMVLIWGGYMSINLLNTPPLHSLDYFTSDEESTEILSGSVEGGIDPIGDIALTKVNSILYNQQRRRHKKSRSSQLFSVEREDE